MRLPPMRRSRLSALLVVPALLATSCTDSDSASRTVPVAPSSASPALAASSCPSPTAPPPPHPAVLLTMLVTEPGQLKRPPGRQVRVGDHLTFVLPEAAVFAAFVAEPAAHVTGVPAVVPEEQKRVAVDLLQPGTTRFTASDTRGKQYALTVVGVC